jgi:hypothetical protein
MSSHSIVFPNSWLILSKISAPISTFLRLRDVILADFYSDGKVLLRDRIFAVM